MFELVQYGIAMGGSHENLLKQAYKSTDDVANDGIYNALVEMKLI